ncbi:MAG: DUF4292 domain-containing protein [Cyclobacteriaceae bacterium]|jgi:hypothetical protein|nr:DUF4292 domain-containing protein [Flammeovirgaceae bacterium]
MNKHSRFLFYLKSQTWVVFCAALLLMSCSKKAIPTLPLPPKSIDIQEIDFEYFHGKARLNFKDNTKEREVKANIRIRKDSVIWMTFSVIGVQGGKALINKDSITIVSTVNKEYYVYSYEELSKRFNFKIDFYVIQAAMLGNLIIPKQTIDDIQEEEKFNRMLQSQGTVGIKNYINKETKKLEMVELSESGTGNQLKLDYSDFQPVGEKLFPYKGVIDVLYKSAKGLVNNTIVFEYSKAEVGDRELRFPFNIPKRYDRR